MWSVKCEFSRVITACSWSNHGHPPFSEQFQNSEIQVMGVYTKHVWRAWGFTTCLITWFVLTLLYCLITWSSLFGRFQSSSAPKLVCPRNDHVWFTTCLINSIVWSLDHHCGGFKVPVLQSLFVPVHQVCLHFGNEPVLQLASLHRTMHLANCVCPSVFVWSPMGMLWDL